MNGESITFEPLSPAEQKETRQLFEERADHLSLGDFAHNTVLASGSEEWVTALTAQGAKLLVGPRGCGKTHLMRYAYVSCIENQLAPFAVYTNFNRYYRLEPLLRRRAEAISLFYTWVLGNIVVGLFDAVYDFANKTGPDVDAEALLGLERQKVEDVIGALERGGILTPEQIDLAALLTIDRVKGLLVSAGDTFDRKRTVLLMDDAALTLAPEFMSHFFDIFRALKSARIAPKASVYPATTEYGASFHVAHEAEPISVWKKVTDGNYQSFMQGIAEKRFPEAIVDIPSETLGLLAYAAFGVPRTYMALVRSYTKAQAGSPGATSQKWFNSVIEDFCAEKLREYGTLSSKTPLLATIINVGATCFNKIVDDVAAASQSLANAETRQIYVGVQTDGLENAYVSRMFGLLEEAGMLYRSGKVSHGDRDYERFIPHLGALVQARAFSRGGGFSPRFATEMLSRPDEKHPVRRSIQTLIGQDVLSSLKLDLPNCDNCGAKRAEAAKYCHQCGAMLTDVSSYERCMGTALADVPGLTTWQREKLASSSKIPKAVGEFLALQDKGTALRTVRQIGRKRAENVIDAVDSFLEEFLAG